MNQKGSINIILILVVVALVGTGIVGMGIYVVLTRQTPSPVPTPTPTPSPSLIPTPTPTPDETQQPIFTNNTTSKTPTSIQWVWTNLGCGSTAPCSYRVCSATNPKECYSCRGKYDKLSSEGEKSPEKNENPQIATNFVCELSSWE